MIREIIAHRGCSHIAPENTLAAFVAAIEQGADAIELDVQLSADDIPIIIHDATLDRTTNSSGLVREKNLIQLQHLDAGTWFSSQFSSESIPTWQQVLDLLKNTNLRLYAEVKEANYWSEAAIDNFVANIIAQGWQKRCIVASFEGDFLTKIRQRNQEITLGYHCAESAKYQDKLERAAKDTNAVILCEYQLLLNNPALIESSKNKGVEIVAWTVDSLQDRDKLFSLGVKRLITNSLFLEQ